MVFDYGKLRGKIREVYGTQAKFAEALRLSSASLSAKLNNGSEFTQDEIYQSCELLQISRKEVSAYFFTPIVQYSKPVAS